jgi:hypothetical protein
MRRLIALCAAIAALVAGVVVATGVAGATGMSNSRSVEGGPGTFAITGNVKHRLVLNTAVLSRVPSKTLTVTYKSGSATDVRLDRGR